MSSGNSADLELYIKFRGIKLLIGNMAGIGIHCNLLFYLIMLAIIHLNVFDGSFNERISLSLIYSISVVFLAYLGRIRYLWNLFLLTASVVLMM